MNKTTYADLLGRPKLRAIMKNNKESRLQQQFVYWFRTQYPEYAMLMTHPINEGSGHSEIDRKRQAIHKAEGTVAGVTDLLLFLPAEYRKPFGHDGMELVFHYHGLGIEWKTPTGRQSQEQKDFQKMFEAAGYKYVVVRTLDEGREVVNDYIAHVLDWIIDRIRNARKELIKAQDARELAYFKKVIGKK